ncbi:unnamed protein product [Mytilus edulis]|uniref:Uncharacterized protein n=1 Tax=Mytilus edulis TaxID=6550 RepID=A0A8S3V4W7_MYTED|nr:unnamed protein product [Mytilus edulis]
MNKQRDNIVSMYRCFCYLKPVKCLLNHGSTTALLDYNGNLFSVPEYEGEPHCSYYPVVRNSPLIRSEVTETRKVESLLQDISLPSGLSIYHDGFINHICAVNSMDGSTTLHTCLLKETTSEIMELLLKIDPNDMTVNIQNSSGLTPLHLACQLERRKCTEILVVSILFVFDKLTT